MQAPSIKLVKNISSLCKRNLGISAPVLQKASDPIQQLFVDKIREFKSKSVGGKLVEPSPELTKELQMDKERVYRQFGFQPGQDLSQFPTFNFKDEPLESPHMDQPKQTN